jgi:NADH-quinone oxidoreductase subunit E
MLSEEARARMREVVGRYPTARSAMLPCLHIAQEEEDYITPEGVAAVAEAVGARPDEVDMVVSFYSMFFRKPAGRHVVKVCTSISCYLRGCDSLMAHLEQRLGIKSGETTADGAFTLLPIECLASCGTAPVLQVNDQFVENVTLEGADALIERLRGSSREREAGSAGRSADAQAPVREA